MRPKSEGSERLRADWSSPSEIHRGHSFCRRVKVNWVTSKPALGQHVVKSRVKFADPFRRKTKSALPIENARKERESHTQIICRVLIPSTKVVGRMRSHKSPDADPISFLVLFFLLPFRRRRHQDKFQLFHSATRRFFYLPPLLFRKPPKNASVTIVTAAPSFLLPDTPLSSQQHQRITKRERKDEAEQ